MKHISILTTLAAATFAAFIGSIALGFVSLPVFLAAAMTWVLLLTVYAYTPNRQRAWLPRTTSARLVAQSGRRAHLPLAA